MSSFVIMSESHTMKSIPKLELKPVELEFYKSNPVEFMKDIDCLFNVTKNVLNYSTSVADRCLLGKQTESKPPTPDIKSNLARNILKQICCKVSCEKEGDVIGTIQKITPTYSWAERAVLTLAAFASSFGEIMCKIEIRETNKFVQLVSWLKQADVLAGFQQNQQFRKAIDDLNELSSRTENIVMNILELEKLSNPGFKIEHRSLLKNKKIHLEHYSRLAISAAVACMAQVNYLTFDRFSIEEAIPKWISALKENLPRLREDIQKFKSEIAEWVYRNLDSCFGLHEGIVSVFAWFMYPQEPVLDCHGAEKPFGVEKVLRDQNVLLFISEVKIPPFDYLAMQRIHQELITRNLNYKIVWMPMVQEWTPEFIKEFNKVKQEMQWHILCYETTEPIVGIEYIKRRWQYSYRPMVVVLNSLGGIECPDAMPMIRIWGFHAFPFTLKPSPADAPIPPIIHFLDKKIKEETYFFLYGGTKDSWAKDVGTKFSQMISDVYFKNTKTVVVSFSGEKEKGAGIILPKREEIWQFWNCIDSLLFVMMQYNKLNHPVTKEIQKLLSLKNEEGWVALCKGSRVLVCGSGDPINQAVTQFINNLKNDLQKYGTLEVCLRNYLKPHQPPCCHMSLQNCNGWLPAEVKCPDCGCRMERIVTYKCCHPTPSNISGA